MLDEGAQAAAALVARCGQVVRDDPPKRGMSRILGQKVGVLQEEVVA